MENNAEDMMNINFQFVKIIIIKNITVSSWIHTDVFGCHYLMSSEAEASVDV